MSVTHTPLRARRTTSGRMPPVRPFVGARLRDRVFLHSRPVPTTRSVRSRDVPSPLSRRLFVADARASRRSSLYASRYASQRCAASRRSRDARGRRPRRSLAARSRTFFLRALYCARFRRCSAARCASRRSIGRPSPLRTRAAARRITRARFLGSRGMRVFVLGLLGIAAQYETMRADCAKGCFAKYDRAELKLRGYDLKIAPRKSRISFDATRAVTPAAS